MEREPTPLGWYLVRRMADHNPPLNQADFAKAMGAAQATISRWVYDPIKPKPELLHRAAEALGTHPRERSEIYTDLLGILGYVDPSATQAERSPTNDDDPEVRDILDRIGRVLRKGANSTERATLLAVLAGVIAPYEDRLRPTTRRRTG